MALEWRECPKRRLLESTHAGRSASNFTFPTAERQLFERRPHVVDQLWVESGQAAFRL